MTDAAEFEMLVRMRRKIESYRSLELLCRNQAAVSSTTGAKRELEAMASEYAAMASWLRSQGLPHSVGTAAEEAQMREQAGRTKLPKREYEPRCPACAAFPQLRNQFMEPVTGRTIRLYQCECGQRVWED